ncbi:MAG: hypothetical protein R3C32_01855 [Chloroflexota bacterium]
MALAWVPDATGAWHGVRVAFGSVAAVPVRVAEVEAVLEGSVIDAAATHRAIAALGASIRPIDDVRSTADYRREVSGRIAAPCGRRRRRHRARHAQSKRRAT